MIVTAGNNDILRQQLHNLGYPADSAEASQAVARLKTQEFDIALVDFAIPGMTGLAVLDAIKADPGSNCIPVVMLTELHELTGVIQCIERGAEDYIFKPIQPVLLTARIESALERVRLRRRECERTNELERMSQEMRRSNEDLKRFAYMASHDLQGPLRTITAYLQLLERRLGPRMSADEMALFEFPIDAAKRMNQLIRDLLTYSQVSTGERMLEPVACEDVLAGTIEDLSSEVQESQATITYDPLPVVAADRVQLRQLFLNLIGNAIKYRCEQAPRIHVSACREHAKWHFTVSDNGVGIPPEYADEVFKVFRRLHGRDRPGTGLGLAICKRITEHLGGQIWVESQAGAGSTFHFTVPDAERECGRFQAAGN